MGRNRIRVVDAFGLLQAVSITAASVKGRDPAGPVDA
jgi:hypothetical protein